MTGLHQRETWAYGDGALARPETFSDGGALS